MPVILVGQYKVILLSLLFGAILGLIYEFCSFLGCVSGFKDIKDGQKKSKTKLFLLGYVAVRNVYVFIKRYAF